MILYVLTFRVWHGSGGEGAHQFEWGFVINAGSEKGTRLALAGGLPAISPQAANAAADHLR